MTSQHLQRGTAVAVNLPRGGWSAILLHGPSGSGKSDLALRLLETGGNCRFDLISDDYVSLEWAGKAVLASPAPEIDGLLEVRGIGFVKRQTRGQVPLLVAFQMARREEIDRLPESKYLCLAISGEKVKIPQFDIDPFAASAVAKVLAGVDQILEQRK